MRARLLLKQAELRRRLASSGDFMQFQVEGKIRLGKEERKFSKTVDAESEKAATDKVLALFGSHNRIKRSAVKIESVKKLGG